MNTPHDILDQYEAAYIGILLWLPVEEARRYAAAVVNADITTPALRDIHRLIAVNLDNGQAGDPRSVLAAIETIEHTKHWKTQLATTLADTYTNAALRNQPGLAGSDRCWLLIVVDAAVVEK